MSKKSLGLIIVIFSIILVSGCRAPKEEIVKCNDYIIGYMSDNGWEVYNEENAEFKSKEDAVFWNVTHDYFLVERDNEFFDIDIRNKTIYRNDNFNSNLYNDYRDDLNFNEKENATISIHQHLTSVGCQVYGQSPDILIQYKEVNKN